MYLCQEEIERDRQGVVDEASVEGVGVVAGWEVIDLEPGQVVSAFAQIVELDYPIRWQHLAII